MNSLAPKSDFLNLEGVTHLAAGGQTPPLRVHQAALERFLHAKGTGMRGHALNLETRARAADRVAQLIGCQADDVGFSSSVAHAVTLIAESMDWQPGDNVVMEQWEFPSLLNPWLALRERGVEVRLLQPEGWRAPLERVRAEVDERTRVLALSQVSYLTGERHDLEAYASIAHDAGAILLVDSSHALGAVSIPSEHADFVVSCCYKWVLGVQGVAVTYWNRRRLPEWRPRSTGWHSSPSIMPLERGRANDALATGIVFEPGNPSFAGIYLLDSSLEYLLSYGIEAIERHVVALNGELRWRVAELGLPVMTPEEPAQRAGNVSFSADDAPRIRAALEAEGVLVTGEDGRVRISTHLYNDLADVERGVEVLAKVVKA